MNQWISVKEKLPDQYEWVLVSCVDENYPTRRYVPSVGIYRNGIWATKESDEYFNHSERVQSNDMEKIFQIKVTHWMSLPKSP